MCWASHIYHVLFRSHVLKGIKKEEETYLTHKKSMTA